MPFTGRRRILGLLCVIFSIPAPAAAQRLQSDELKLRADLAAYLEIVHEYRRGRFGEAVDRLLLLENTRVSTGVDSLLMLAEGSRQSTQPGTTVVRLVSLLASPPQSEDDVDLADIEASVLLHTDASYRAWALRQSRGVTDHLTAADRIATWLRDTLEKLRLRPGFARIDPSLPRLNLRDWCLSTVQALTGMSEIDLALGVLKKSLALYPGDSDLWLASGTAREYMARVLAVGLDTTPSPDKSQFFVTAEGRRTILQVRQAAERDFRKALDIDPSSVEARVRLGRILMQSDQDVRAEKEFRAVLAATGDAYFRYLASMYLGRVLELRKQVKAAADLYRDAIRLEPDCQACRVALAHALEALGEPGLARAELRSFMTVRESKPESDDGWWVYPYGRAEDADRAMKALRRQVQFK